MKQKTILIVIMIAVILFSILQLFQYLIGFKNYKNRAIKEVLELRSNFDWTKMNDAETHYNSMMIDIITTYSFKYDKKYRKAMNPDQRSEYIRQNKIYADALSFNPFEVPCISLLESSFNPWLDHEYGEIGINGIKYETALWCEKIQQKYMPDHLRRLLFVDLKTRQDLKDPIIALRVTYTLIWYNRRLFNGRQDWYVSVYHWGGFLSRHWDYRKKDGDVPITFTLNGIEYNVMKYYIAFRELLTAFNSGKLQAGREIVEKWKAYYKQKCREELQYREMKGIIRSLKKQLNEKTDIEKKLKDKHKRIEEELKKADTKMRKISGEVKKGAGKQALDKVKGVARDLLNKLK